MKEETSGILISVGNDLNVKDISISVSKCLKKLEIEYGLKPVNITIEKRKNLGNFEYRISGYIGTYYPTHTNSLYGSFKMYPALILAIKTTNIPEEGLLKGKKTKEPSFDLDAVWIRKCEAKKAKLAGYLTVSSEKVFQVHLYEILKSIRCDFVSEPYIRKILRKLYKTNLQLARTIGDSYTIDEIKTIFSQLINDNLNPLNYEIIFQKMSDLRRLKTDYLYICNEIHIELGAETCKKYLENNVLSVTVINDENELNNLKKIMYGKNSCDELAYVVNSIAIQLCKTTTEFPDTQLIICCPEKFRYILRTFFKNIGLLEFPILSFEEIAVLRIKTNAKLNIISHLSIKK